MRKILAAIVVASALIVGISAPAHAGEEVQAGSDSYGLYTQRCETNLISNNGVYAVDVCMRVSYWQYNDHIAVKRVRIWARGATGQLALNNSLDVIYSTVTGPAGGINWLKENININRDTVNDVSRNWEPNFNQGNNGQFYLHGKVHWSDGTADEFSFTQTGLDQK
jgi:ABC-type transport system substrate-binding protein